MQSFSTRPSFLHVPCSLCSLWRALYAQGSPSHTGQEQSYDLGKTPGLRVRHTYFACSLNTSWTLFPKPRLKGSLFFFAYILSGKHLPTTLIKLKYVHNFHQIMHSFTQKFKFFTITINEGANDSAILLEVTQNAWEKQSFCFLRSWLKNSWTYFSVDKTFSCRQSHLTLRRTPQGRRLLGSLGKPRLRNVCKLPTFIKTAHMWLRFPWQYRNASPSCTCPRLPPGRGLLAATQLSTRFVSDSLLLFFTILLICFCWIKLWQVLV